MLVGDDWHIKPDRMVLRWIAQHSTEVWADPAYTMASNSAGTSATHPAIAVNDRIPATTAPAHNASTAATG